MDNIKHLSNSQFELLAFKYFEGLISSEEELVLFDHLKSDRYYSELFLELEKKWMNSNDKSVDLSHQWALIESRIKARAFENRINGRRVLFGKILRVAALVALIISGPMITARLLRSSGERIIVEAPYGEKSKVTLHDGSVVWLNSGSKLTYNTKIDNSIVSVDLDGEGYFIVAKDKKRKFIVHTSEYDVEVKGTRFNVAAYSDDRFITTTLIDGSVNLIRDNVHTVMKPGESLSYDRVGKSLINKTVEADASYEWIDNIIVYDNIRLGDLVKKLERRFNLSIVYDKKELEAKQFNIALRNGETLNDIMQALQIILNVDVKVENDVYYITKR
jgi:ferric-dicitrate binding protein FerR (iron transport regulator)